MNGGLHHLHARRRTYKHLSPYPHPTPWKRQYDNFMYVVAICSPMSLIPQIIDLYVLRDAGALSFATWTTLLGLNILWVAYGVIHGDKPIYISSMIAGVLDVILVVGIIVYS